MNTKKIFKDSPHLEIIGLKGFQFRRRAAYLLQCDGVFSPDERGFLKKIVLLGTGQRPTLPQMRWLLSLSRKGMYKQVKYDEQRGKYRSRMTSIIGGNQCAECYGLIPDDRFGVSNFCCEACLLK